MNFFTHIFQGFSSCYLLFFLGIISWKGASWFKGEGVFLDVRASFLSGGGRGGAHPMGEHQFGWGFLNKIIGWGEVPPVTPTMGNPVTISQSEPGL